jgi:hypothetical protein
MATLLLVHFLIGSEHKMSIMYRFAHDTISSASQASQLDIVVSNGRTVSTLLQLQRRC